MDCGSTRHGIFFFFFWVLGVVYCDRDVRLFVYHDVQSRRCSSARTRIRSLGINFHIVALNSFLLLEIMPAKVIHLLFQNFPWRLSGDIHCNNS